MRGFRGMTDCVEHELRPILAHQPGDTIDHPEHLWLDRGGSL
jgi:hypothetical protein